MSGKTDRKRMRWWGVLLICLAVTCVLALGAAAAVWELNEFKMSVTLRGDQEMVLEYGEAWKDPGVDATFSGTLLVRQAQPVSTKVQGSVDPKVLGTYTLTYTAEKTLGRFFWARRVTASVSRTVCVADTQAPQITLTEVPGNYTLPGTQYVEEGFFAVDNYDGDLTDQVQRRVTDESIVYTVTDSSGNTASVTREIFYDDPVPPILRLEGMEQLTISQGTSYREAGYTAEDNCDGDITDRVTVTGSVDVNTPGTYVLEYSVSDSYGNTARCTREVTVKAIPEGKIIYLTFDDGPGRYTQMLLDVLDKYNVKVTFFVTANGDPSLIAKEAEAGHTVAMHTACHNYSKIYASEEAYFEDLYKIQDLIYSYTGERPTLLRFPGGSSNTVSGFNEGIMTRLTKEVEDRGFEYFDWNVDSNDAGGATTSDEVFQNVTRGVSGRNVSVVLQHDIKEYSVKAVERIIQWGLENGYTFLPLTSGSPGAHHRVNN